MLVGYESAHSATEEWFHPAILQSAEGIFQHYVHWPYSMYTTHEGTPSDSAQILHRYNTRLIQDLSLYLDWSLFLILWILHRTLLGLLLVETTAGPYVIAVGLVATGQSAQIEHIVTETEWVAPDYTVVMVHIVVVQQATVEAQIVAAL